MMPLWMRTTLPARCGWAFCSDGRPCVAHRVWPMPDIASAPSPRPALRSRPAPHTLLDGRGLRGRRAGRLRPAARHPAREGPLRDAAHDERAGRDVAGDGRPGADVGVVPDRDRGDELRVAPDLDTRPDLCVVLRE